jgi:hypothetical protein
MSVRISILDAFYTKLTLMTVVNGFNYDWTELKSVGNGSYAPNADLTVANFSIEPETSSTEQGQGLYFLAAPLVIKAYQKYTRTGVKENDYDKEVVRSNLIEDLRKMFGIANNFNSSLCVAGLDDINYTGERLEPDLGSNTSGVELEFEIKWYDGRVV